MSTRPPLARLSLSDGMLLIGANAISLAGFILVDDHLFDGGRHLFGLLNWSGVPWTATFYLAKAQGASAALASAFGAWTLILPLVGLRKPPLVRLRLFRSPGLSACVGASVGMLFGVLAALLALAVRAAEGRVALPPNYWYAVPAIDGVFILAGVGVAATWAGQATSGRWRPSPDAIDRLGRAIGLLWLGAGVVFAVRLFLG